MKSGDAAAVIACRDFVKAYPDFEGRIGVLITSDEEGEAVDGVKHVVETFPQLTEADFCIMCEPSSDKKTGDAVVIGVKGIYSVKLEVLGTQGHVAYLGGEHNAIHKALPLLERIISHKWCSGSEHFPPTSVHIVQAVSDSSPDNVIPSNFSTVINWRHSNLFEPEKAKQLLASWAKELGLKVIVSEREAGDPYLTRSSDNPELTLLVSAIKKVTGRETRFKTGLGTSDNRFISTKINNAVEFGVPEQTMHETDERVAVESVKELARIYYQFMTDFFKV